MWASLNDHKDVAVLLLDRGADIHEKSNNGNNALILASMKGHKDVVKLLLDWGANIHIKNNDDYNALMWASSIGNNEIVEFLLENGININDNDFYGDNAVIIASKNNYLSILKLLLNDKYINKEHLINYNYIYLPLPRKIEFEKIKLIEIKPENKNIKVCINYEKVYEYELKDYDIEKYNKLSLKEKLEKTISIDTGMENLLTIYNPTGIQQIIKGGTIKSINNFYNKKIDKLNSINKKEHDKSDYGRLHSLLKERENKINGHINKIIDTLVEEYKEKEVFIIGYNPNWKNKVNMGRKNNRNFYMIPYNQEEFNWLNPRS
jgi:IS605 OrfB family transposase